MSKESALKNLTDHAISNMLADIPISKGLEGHADKEAVVRAYQEEMGLPVDGWPGDDTLSTLWREWQPSPSEIALAAERALEESGKVAYTQGSGGDIGEVWFPDRIGTAGDCSDFVCHCLGIPKKQFTRFGALAPGWKADPQWLGAANISAGCIGKNRPWTTAAVGDLVAYGGVGAHVEVVVGRTTGKSGAVLWTIGCSNSSFKNFGTAIARRNRSGLWGRRNAVAVTPWWNV